MGLGPVAAAPRKLGHVLNEVYPEPAAAPDHRDAAVGDPPAKVRPGFVRVHLCKHPVRVLVLAVVWVRQCDAAP